MRLLNFRTQQVLVEAIRARLVSLREWRLKRRKREKEAVGVEEEKELLLMKGRLCARLKCFAFRAHTTIDRSYTYTCGRCFEKRRERKRGTS